MAHGTPSSPDDLEAFSTRIRRGQAPSAGQLAELRRRYDAIGGISPLAARTGEQARALAAVLEADAPGRYLVRVGTKHAEPTIEGAAAELVEAGVDQVVGLVLTPHQSSMGSEEYLARAARALGGPVRTAPSLRAVRHWYELPGFAELWARRVRASLAELGPVARPMVVCTAHSLPERIVQHHDPYPDQVAESATRVASASGVTHWRVAWQSAARTSERWLGPGLLEVLEELARDQWDGVVVCPVGFVADHLEVLYDLDVEARAAAEGKGLRFARAASLNDDPALARVLAAAVHRAEAGPADGERPAATGALGG